MNLIKVLGGNDSTLPRPTREITFTCGACNHEQPLDVPPTHDTRILCGGCGLLIVMKIPGADRGPAKTGSMGRPWVTLERPKPPRVEDRYAYWNDPPPEMSERCAYWLRQINAGWLPNRRISMEGYDGRAAWFGVWIWEYLHLLAPAIDRRRAELRA